VKEDLATTKQLLDENKEQIQEVKKEIQEVKDDEISIDFSKIKNFFKKSKEDAPKEHGDDEISFDFSKIKNFFKGSKEDKDGDTIDFKKVTGFAKQYSMVLLLLIPIIFSVGLRSMPSDLPVTDQWAQNTLHNNIRNQIINEIQSQYPNLPAENIDNLVETRFQQLLKEQQSQIDPQISQVSAQFKERLQKDGQTYLIAIDPYFWMRNAGNILERGHQGDELRNQVTKELCTKRGGDCVPWNNHMIAPIGKPASGDMLHAYVIAYVHRFLSIFNPNQDLMGSAFIIPIIISSLCVIPAFFIARKISGNFGGFIAGMFVAIHPALLTRTVGGFSDTDAYTVFFPLFITWIFIEAFDSKSLKKSAILSFVAGLLIPVYRLTWASGWWNIFLLLFGSLSLSLVVYILINRTNIRNMLKIFEIRHAAIVLGTFFFAVLISMTLTADFATFAGAFLGPLNFIRFKEVGITTVWPNVLTTVAEQNPSSLNNVIGQIGIGSILLYLLSILGIILSLTRTKNKDKKDLYFVLLSAVWMIIIISIRPQNLVVFLSLIALPMVARIILAIYFRESAIDFRLAIVLILWFASTTYASTKGVRFLLLLVPAFAIGIGISFGILTKYLSRFLSKGIYLNKTLAYSIITIMFLLLLITPVKQASSVAKNEIPSMNDAWYTSLDRIRTESEPDAIINSWWDFGHWFKAIGDRAVTFDGTSQDTPMAHWIGNVLMTNDEDKGVGILRMLDCGSNTAFDRLDEDIKDTALSVQILHEVVRLERSEAKKILLDYVGESKAEEVLKLTHCDPPENYFITSDDMIGKSGVWAHFGSWNFDRALIYNTLKKSEYEGNKEKSKEFLIERFDYSDQQAEDMYFEVRGIKDSGAANSWIAPWPSYASGVSGCQTINATTVLCGISQQGGSINVRVDLEKIHAEVDTTQGKLFPNSVVIPTKEGIEKRSYKNNTLGFSMTLLPAGNDWNYVLTAPPLEDSMFTILYFLEGHGLSHFKKFSEERSVIGNRIVVWKVDWEGEEMNNVYFKEPEPPIIVPADSAEESTQEVDADPEITDDTADSAEESTQEVDAEETSAADNASADIDDSPNGT